MFAKKSLLILPIFALLATLTGCGGEEAPPPAAPPAPAKPAAPAAPAKPATNSAPAKPATLGATKDPFDLAEDKAASATSLSQSAQTKEDWKLVESRWNEAITLMKQVRPEHPKKAEASKKLADYQTKLATAKQKASQPK